MGTADGGTAAGTASGGYWLALAAAIGASPLGQALLKAGATGLPPAADGLLATLPAQLLRWQTAAGLLSYAGSTLLFIVALRRIPLSVAMPCTAASYVAAAALGAALFGEPLTAQKLAGLLLVCLGVRLLATSDPGEG